MIPISYCVKKNLLKTRVLISAMLENTVFIKPFIARELQFLKIIEKLAWLLRKDLRQKYKHVIKIQEFIVFIFFLKRYFIKKIQKNICLFL